jgi:hypothetical protein
MLYFINIYELRTGYTFRIGGSHIVGYEVYCLVDTLGGILAFILLDKIISVPSVCCL